MTPGDDHCLGIGRGDGDRIHQAPGHGQNRDQHVLQHGQRELLPRRLVQDRSQPSLGSGGGFDGDQDCGARPHSSSTNFTAARATLRLSSGPRMTISSMRTRMPSSSMRAASPASALSISIPSSPSRTES